MLAASAPQAINVGKPANSHIMGVAQLKLQCHVNQTRKQTTYESGLIVRGDRDSRANLMPIYGDLYQIKL